MKILFEFRTAIDVKNVTTIPVSRGYERKKQYVDGLKKISRHYSKFSNCDFVLVDNTLENESKLPEEIENLLPENCFLYIKNKNNYGKFNKGAGDIDLWKDYSDILISYDYFFHYEPRLQLTDFSFIESFLKNPRNYFCLDETCEQVKTGYFGVNVKDFYEFYSKVNLDEMVSNRVSIELLLFSFFKDKDTEFIKDSFYTLWHDAHINQYRKY